MGRKEDHPQGEHAEAVFAESLLVVKHSASITCFWQRQRQVQKKRHGENRKGSRLRLEMAGMKKLKADCLEAEHPMRLFWRTYLTFSGWF